MEKTKIKPLEKTKLSGITGRCPDYDSERVDVKDPCVCFVGIFEQGKRNLGTAKGYCPMIHSKN